MTGTYHDSFSTISTMQAYELVVIIVFIAVIWYWLDGIRVKELARQAGRRACDQDHVAFLDDTVVLQKIRLQRNTDGHMHIWRSYDFEFTSDGSCRYRGNISMLGKTVSSLFLETHRLPPGL